MAVMVGGSGVVLPGLLVQAVTSKAMMATNDNTRKLFILLPPIFFNQQ